MDPVRPSTQTVEYKKCKWADAFTSFSLDTQVQEKYAKAIEGLKEEARSMLLAAGNMKSEKLVLIDTLEHLGVAYHFDQEIEEHLEQIFKSNINEDEEDYDLFITSLQFRLLRQHRYHASSGTFNKFKCQDNKFKKNLESDAKGLLSLYEAAHLRIHGEETLDEAVGFTVHHLKRMVRQLDSPLQDQVKRALVLPRHRSSPEIESRHYISLYEKDKSKNEVLLKLAKLDLSYVQNLYKKELCELYRWWDEMKPQFPYARSRIVHGYLWGTTSQFKPQHSYDRVALGKLLQMMTIIDDTYDNYATIEEADMFTEALHRWNIGEIEQLPNYMKVLYRLILRIYDDYEREAREGGKQFDVHYAKETVTEICKAYNKELKWFTRSVPMPSFEDYNINGIITSCIHFICAWMILSTTSVAKETVDWLRSEPKIVKAAAMIGRYLNNLSSYERENQNGQALTGVEIYMTHHGLSMQETVDKIIELVENAWKDLNTEWMAIDSVPKDVLEMVVGYARTSEIFYRSFEDGYTESEVLGPHISALYVDHIPISI